MKDEMKPEERFKFTTLRRLASEAFEAIDRKEHVTVSFEELDGFLEMVSSQR